MKRVFYLSGLNLTVFQWQGKDFAGSYTFQKNDVGLDEFEKYLEIEETGTVKILVDVVEEDFIKDTIPHVGMSDRGAIVKRYINRLYRKSDGYYTSKIVGREIKGRKDDIILYSVITNPDVFSIWLDIIVRKKVALSGIWSLPLISENTLKKITNVGGNLLLVSQQVSSNLRQSFFVNGRYEISRNAVINLDDMSLGEYINEEVEQTTRFLANQRYIGFDDVVNVHIICPSFEIENIERNCEDTPLKIYHYHSIDTVKTICGCDNMPGILSSNIFAYQCKSNNDFNGHYGPKQLFKYFYQKLIRNSIYVMNTLLIMVSMIFVFNNMIGAQVLKAEEAVLNEQKIDIDNKYDREYKNHENELSRAVAIQSSVKFYDRVSSLRSISPQSFMNRFSLILDKSGVDNIIITELSWSSSQGNKISNTNSNMDLHLSSGQMIKHFASIKGVIGSESDTFDNAVKKVNALLSELNKHEVIENLEIVKMPYDIRPESKLNNSHAQGDDDISNNNSHRSFEFLILLKGESNA